MRAYFRLKKIKAINPHVYVIMNTAYGDIQLAVESMKLGAVDFLVKPLGKGKIAFYGQYGLSACTF